MSWETRPPASVGVPRPSRALVPTCPPYECIRAATTVPLLTRSWTNSRMKVESASRLAVGGRIWAVEGRRGTRTLKPCFSNAPVNLAYDSGTCQAPEMMTMVGFSSAIGGDVYRTDRKTSARSSSGGRRGGNIL
ncbi:unnamed protein product [Periconia digitata]|uniref:Uncharacterized protein n=1 Tax=Periconia digitata TaxID=1303443 RepID=A0A9W4U9E6_9PLEO|nr:unnamed protein product [Periconia digitata]